MPMMDGYFPSRIIEAHKQCKNPARMRNILIVAVTGLGAQGDLEKCQKVGMDDYLALPVKRKLLERTLVKWTVEGICRRELA